MRSEPRYHKILASAGKAIERGFFARPVTDKLERLPNLLALYAGSLDDPSAGRLESDI